MIEQWAADTAGRYPQLLSVCLVGSRADGTAKPGSDYDVILCLHKDDPDLEQRIANENRHRPIDIFWLRANGHVARWQKAGNQTGKLPGEQFGQWELLYMSLNSAVIVYERQAGMAEVLLTQRRDPLRPLLVDLRRLINWLNTFRFHVARRLSLPVDIQIFDAPNFVRLIDGRVIVIPPEGE